MSHNRQPNEDLLQTSTEDLFSELESEIADIKDEVAQENIAFELRLELKDGLAELKRQSPEDYEILLEELRDEG